jgi:hypothetical protein
VFSAWIQNLRDDLGVAVLIASDPRKPSEPRVVNGRVNFPTLRHRLFTQGLINLTSAGGSRKVRVDNRNRLSLDAMHLSINESVRELTRGRQLTGCYIPDSVSPNQPLIDLSRR